jgi:transcriptional regulator with XRE-family HTH domain
MRGTLANSEELQLARLRCGLTQEELATLADLDVKTVRKAEHGLRLDLDTLTRLAYALECDLSQLIRPVRSETDRQITWRDAVMRWHRAWDAHDMESLLSVYDDNAIMHLPGGPNIPFGGTSTWNARCLSRIHFTAMTKNRCAIARTALRVGDHLLERLN